MANKMTTTIIAGAGTTVEIDGIPVSIWQKFKCEFEHAPSSLLLSKNQRKMRKHLNRHLESLEDGDFYSLIILWNRIKSTVFTVVVAIYETDPPPEGGTPPPTPPPQGPGDMNG